MKAIVYTQYGSPEVLQLKEIPVPKPKANEILIKLYATSINASDWEFLTGTPLYTRMWGLCKPKFKILGSDVAGIVEEVGRDVTHFKPGNAVCGDIMGHWGGFAEFACAPAEMFVIKPDSISFEHAAAIPQAAMVAWQGLHDRGEITTGHNVLINGAGGGSGSFAIQIARLAGAEVTGVDRGDKLATMRELGAEYLVDYTRQDCTKTQHRYDLILDFVASHSVWDYKRILKSDGRYIMVGGNMKHIFGKLILGGLISLTSSHSMRILAAKPNKDILEIIELVTSGQIKTVIDKIYGLDDVPEAMNYVGAGNTRGKVIISMQ